MKWSGNFRKRGRERGFAPGGIPNEELGAKCPRQPHQGNINPMLLGHSAGCLPCTSWEGISSQCRLMTCLPATPQGVRGNGQPCGGRPVGYMATRRTVKVPDGHGGAGTESRNRPKGLFAVARRGFGRPIMAALPEPVPDPDIQAAARGPAEARQGRGPSANKAGRCSAKASCCRELRCCRQGWMLPLVGTCSCPRPGCAQPRARRSTWSVGRGKRRHFRFRGLGLGPHYPGRGHFTEKQADMRSSGASTGVIGR